MSLSATNRVLSHLVLPSLCLSLEKSRSFGQKLSVPELTKPSGLQSRSTWVTWLSPVGLWASPGMETSHLWANWFSVCPPPQKKKSISYFKGEFPVLKSMPWGLTCLQIGAKKNIHGVPGHDVTLRPQGSRKPFERDADKRLGGSTLFMIEVYKIATWIIIFFIFIF